jgi:phenylpropionate dioxygenase-like ring-hydroxylating dioxygenase large terminal subunit
MRHELQVELLQRVLQHVANGTTDTSEDQQSFWPRIYVDAERLRSERDVLFREYPLVVGFSSQLRAPGDYFTHDLTGVPLLVVRDPDKQVRAFLNMCRHRGAKVAPNAQGKGAKRFICPYHAWSYDPDGALHSLPEKHCFPGLDKERSGLVPLPVAERHGMIFVVPTPGRSLDIDAYLGPVGEDFASFGLDRYQVGAAKNVPGRVDWKLMIEANQETYHINFLHGRTAGRRYREQCSVADQLTPHTRSVLVHSATGRTPLPEDRASWRVLDHADLVYLIFPNTLALWAGEGVQVLSAFPQATGSSIMQGARLECAAEGTAQGKEHAAAFYDIYWKTIGEDIQVSETIQQTASAPLGAPLLLGSNEFLLSAFHRNLEAALRGDLPIPGVARSELAPGHEARAAGASGCEASPVRLPVLAADQHL